MYRYILCIGICALIWSVNGKWIIQAIRERVTSEAYIHTGLGLFLSLLTLELTLGILRLWVQLDILWLRVIGFILYIPSAILVFGSIIELKRKGRPESHDPTYTTTFVDSGMYSIIRQPITLGVAIWSIALILVFQSTVSIVLSASSILCFWISARKEAEYNIRKFGDKYEAYSKRVPMWNIIEGLRRAIVSKFTQ
jgi:protein-S-isoprenylcysteine O-methyltransferase Ste14